MTMTPAQEFTGIFVPTVTPFDSGGRVALDAIPAYVELLIEDGVEGLFVCGSTGEGISLTDGEREQVAEAFLAAAGGRIPVIVQVGHNSVEAARRLAAHAQAIGADAVSACPPSYFNIPSLAVLVETMAHVAGGAPRLPFFYYHIPVVTHAAFSMPEFLEAALERIPNLAGTKFTDPALDEFLTCLAWRDGQGTHFWGVDEMLLPAWSVGAVGAIGTSYNIAAPLFRNMVALAENGDLAGARRLQKKGVDLIRLIARYPFLAAIKAVLNQRGLAMGGCRLPQENLDRAAEARFLEEYAARMAD